MGAYLNPDDLEREATEKGVLNLSTFGVEATEKDILAFFRDSPLIAKASLHEEVGKLRFTDGKLYFDQLQMRGAQRAGGEDSEKICSLPVYASERDQGF